MNEKEALEVTLELKGYIDYVVCELRGKEFDIKKLNKLQNYIQAQEEQIALLKRDVDTRDLMRKLTVDKLQAKLDKVKEICDERLTDDNFKIVLIKDILDK